MLSETLWKETQEAMLKATVGASTHKESSELCGGGAIFFSFISCPTTTKCFSPKGHRIMIENLHAAVLARDSASTYSAGLLGLFFTDNGHTFPFGREGMSCNTLPPPSIIRLPRPKHRISFCRFCKLNRSVAHTAQTSNFYGDHPSPWPTVPDLPLNTNCPYLHVFVSRYSLLSSDKVLIVFLLLRKIRGHLHLLQKKHRRKCAAIYRQGAPPSWCPDSTKGQCYRNFQEHVFCETTTCFRGAFRIWSEGSAPKRERGIDENNLFSCCNTCTCGQEYHQTESEFRFRGQLVAARVGGRAKTSVSQN